METSERNDAARYSVDEILDRMETLWWKKNLWRGIPSGRQIKPVVGNIWEWDTIKTIEKYDRKEILKTHKR